MQSTGQKKTHSINVADVEFYDGYWSTDKAGHNIVERARLEDTVYFHMKTKGVKENTSINFNLKEADFFFDDEKFDGKKISQKVTVKNKVIIIELKLPASWEQEVSDDTFSNLELYWNWSYNEKDHSSREEQLSVYFSKRTLYFNLPLDNYNLPDMRSNDGSPLVYLKFMGGMVKGKLKGKALNLANSKIEKAINKIALGKLEKGSLVTNTGRIQKNANAHIYDKDIYTNDGKLLENLKKRKNWGNATETTKGISQYDFFTKTGKRVKVLGFLKEAAFNDKVNFFDVIDLFSYATDETDPFDQPIPDFGLGAFGGVLGSFALVWSVAGLVVSQMKAEDDAFMREDEANEIRKAKLIGLDAVRKKINSLKHNKAYEWRLMSVPTITANKLLKSQFKTFDELENSKFDDNDFSNKINILYRKILNTNSDQYVYIIETIFTDE